MIKKPEITLIVSIFSIGIAAISLYLSFIVYNESRAISFLWKVNSRNDISITLEQLHSTDEQGKRRTTSIIPIWLAFNIVNTGRMTFSIDSIFVYTNPIKGTEIRQFYSMGHRLFQPYIKIKVPPKERFMLPIVVDPGHSKIMLGKIDLWIPATLSKKYMNEFKGKEFTLGDIYELQNEDLRIGRNFRISADVTLSGGEMKTARVYGVGE